MRFDGPVVRLLWRSHRANARLRAELRRVKADLARAQDLCGASGDLIDKLTRERNEARLLNEWAGIQ